MKYPRTFHLPFSPGAGSDDKITPSVDPILGQEVVITEKLDGSNCCLTKDQVFARTHATPARHPSFNWVKQVHAGIAHLIEEDELIFGENCFAIHSIEYHGLPSYFFAFGIFKNGYWLSWEEVKKRANELGLITVPELGFFNFKTSKELQKAIEGVYSQPSVFGGDREGVVVRAITGFKEEDFETSVMKMVRKDHVQTEDHWMHQQIRPQKIKKN